MKEKDLAENYEGLKSVAPKILFFDIETFPNTVKTWGVYEQNALEVVEDWSIACFAWAWGDGKVYSSKRAKKHNDRAVTEQLWDLFNEADYVCGHNAKAFDVRKANTRFLIHGFPPPEPYQIIDTKLIAKRVAGFDSNKLNELGRQLKLGVKEETGGYSLWRGCWEDDPKAWAKMEKYNRQDVVLQRDVYKALRGYDTLHPNQNLFTRSNIQCRVCSSSNLQKRGGQRLRAGWKPRYSCKDCGAFTSGPIIKEDVKIEMI